MLPQAAFARVGGGTAHDGVKVGEIPVSDVFAPLTS